MFVLSRRGFPGFPAQIAYTPGENVPAGMTHRPLRSVRPWKMHRPVTSDTAIPVASSGATAQVVRCADCRRRNG